VRRNCEKDKNKKVPTSVGQQQQQQQLSGRVEAAFPADRGRADYNKARSEKE